MSTESLRQIDNLDFSEIYSNNIEQGALNALKNIKKIYEEVMGTCSEIKEFADGNISEASLYSFYKNNNYKSCSELCKHCHKILAKCKSCGLCKCNNENNSICNITYSSFEQYNVNKENNYASAINYTVPKPFSFTSKNLERQQAKEKKIQDVKKKLEKEVLKETNVQIHTKPVPKSTYLPLYKQMVMQQEKRKSERKDISKKILNNDVKPFNLSSTTVKTKSAPNLISDDNNFKAKPPPRKILSNKFSEILKNKEKVRKMLIAERAQQTLKQSSLPFSEKSFHHSKSLIDLKDFNQESTKQQSKNIAAITERLYTKKCNEILDKWNKKVSLVTVSNISADTNAAFNYGLTVSKSKQSNELLPFTQFPVRMSYASLLREQQIRKHIMLLHELEEENKTEKEEKMFQKKTDYEILNKLKMLDPTSNREKEIEERVRNYRKSQRIRKAEYEKELQNIIERVSKQKLLIERQSKVDEKLASDKENGVSEKSKTSEVYDSETDTEESSNS